MVINEVLYDAPSTDTGKEWIELYNQGDAAVDLSGWAIERGGASFEGAFTFPSGASIGPHAFLLVGEADVAGAQYTASLVFQNGGSATDGIRLVAADGRVGDALLYDAPNTNNLPDESGSPGTSFAPDVSEGKSLARIPDGADTNASGADFQSVSAPTPGAANGTAAAPTPTPTASPTPSASPTAAVAPTLQGVVVNEVLPDPIGSDTAGEFIELWNSTSGTVDVSGAKLDDGEGGSSPYTIPAGTTLAPGAYRSFLSSETKIALNNDGDSARLLSAAGSVVSSLTYGDVPDVGAAWARFGSATEWTGTPTPGAANVRDPVDEDDDAATTATRSRSPSPAGKTPTPSPSVAGSTTRANAPMPDRSHSSTATPRAGAVAGATGGRRRAARVAQQPADESGEDEATPSPTPSPSPSSAAASESSARRRISAPALVLWGFAGILGLLWFLRHSREKPRGTLS